MSVAAPNAFPGHGIRTPPIDRADCRAFRPGTVGAVIEAPITMGQWLAGRLLPSVE
jgi:hypothetical protein